MCRRFRIPKNTNAPRTANTNTITIFTIELAWGTAKRDTNTPRRKLCSTSRCGRNKTVPAQLLHNQTADTHAHAGKHHCYHSGNAADDQHLGREICPSEDVQEAEVGHPYEQGQQGEGHQAGKQI